MLETKYLIISVIIGAILGIYILMLMNKKPELNNKNISPQDHKKSLLTSNEKLKIEFTSSKGTVFNSVAFIEFGKLISDNDPDVSATLDLYVNDSEMYFQKYKNDLNQRFIETSEQVFPEIVLIDALISKNKIVYTDSATEGDDVLTLLDNLVEGNLSKHKCFNELSEVYKSKGSYNTIGNFMHDKEVAPMPFKCIKEAGYSILGIDEGSDSYALLLVLQENMLRVKERANEAGIKIQYSSI